MEIEFFKYQGTGNDFIIIDNRNGNINLDEEQVKKLCDRRFGIGGDGLMFLNTAHNYDFEMKYYNADGKQSSMCGNGGRCLVKFAHRLGLHKNMYQFIATDGEHEATIEDADWVNLKMKDVKSIQEHSGDSVLDTGSPHYVKPVTDIRNLDVIKEGRYIRYTNTYAAKGINVNFVEATNKGIFVRTYERGVEDETLSCGTGVTASALIFAHNDNGFNRVEVQTPGGALAVEFDKLNDQHFENIWLCGPAEFTFKGLIEV